VNPEIKKALQQVVQLREKIDQTVSEKNRREQRVMEISQDQSRIRENMARLSANSDLYMNYVRRLDQQERELDELRMDILAYRETEARQREELRDFLRNLEIDA
jgi:chromosome segregation ATPase